jgi:ubiquinone/menaquinone biosynthesis C-methylase UbiE
VRDRIPATPVRRSLPAGQRTGRHRPRPTDDRLRFTAGTAERLPCPAAGYDLAVTTTSFGHWADQQAGLAECARVLAPGGWLVLTDQFSAWLAPSLIGSRRAKARTRQRATRLLEAAGFQVVQWHRIYAVIINAAAARK